ncbi:MAG: glycosyltransferase family 4 protein [Halobacteriota archaeon]
MKICFISSLYPPFMFGGAEISVRRAAEGLVKKRHEVSVITTSPNKKSLIEDINGVKVYRINPLNLYAMYNHQNQPQILKPFWHFVDIWNPHSYFVIKNILKKENPDIVHTNHLGGLSTSAFSVVKSLKTPCVHTLHDFQLLSPWCTLFRNGKIIKEFNFLERRFMDIKQYLSSSVNIVTAPSKFVLDMHLKNGYFKNSKHIVLPNAIQLNKSEKVKKNYEMIDILYVGQVSKHKGVHILIYAFQQLKYENVRLHIVGKGADVDEFKNIAESDQRILFHGFVPDEELMRFYKKANVIVVPSIWYDNSPTVIYESFINGTPVIGSRIGGIPELIEEGKNGFSFEAGNVDKLKEILVSLIKNPAELISLERGALESVKNYNMEEHIKKLEDLYREVQEEAKTKSF